jgi:competence protein ComEC
VSPKSIAAVTFLAARGFHSAVRGALEADRERWILWIPAAFGCGIALYFTLPREPLWWSGPLAAAILCALAALGRRHSFVLSLAIALLIPALGFTASQFRTWRVAAPILTEEIGPVRISGRVEEVDFGDKGVRMVLADPTIPWLSAAETPLRVRVRLSKRNVFAPGERVSVRVVLRPPPRPAAPGAFDFARFAYFQGLGAVGFALGDARRIAPSGQDGPPNESIDAPSGSLERLRYAIAERIRAALTGERGAVAVALITGFREGIPESVEQNMRDSGLAHLLAISGLHVGLVARTVFLLVRGGCALVPAIALRWPIKKWTAVSAAAVAFGYLFLAGATEPTQRAFLMLLITVIGICLDRGSISMRLVAWAALFILLLSPESLLSVSFQLSFAAVTALVAVYETITARREWAANEPARVQSAGSRIPRYVLQLGLSSMIATLATAPFALYHFNRVAG